jgi:hypothetical protein
MNISYSVFFSYHPFMSSQEVRFNYIKPGNMGNTHWLKKNMH